MLRLSFELLLLNLSLDFFLLYFYSVNLKVEEISLVFEISLTHSVVLNSLSVLL